MFAEVAAEVWVDGVACDAVVAGVACDAVVAGVEVVGPAWHSALLDKQYPPSLLYVIEPEDRVGCVNETLKQM